MNFNPNFNPVKILLTLLILYLFTSLFQTRNHLKTEEKIYRDNLASFRKVGGKGLETKPTQWTFLLFKEWVQSLEKKSHEMGIRILGTTYQKPKGGEGGLIVAEISFLGSYPEIAGFIEFIEEKKGLQTTKILVKEEKTDLLTKLWLKIPEF